MVWGYGDWWLTLAAAVLISAGIICAGYGVYLTLNPPPDPATWVLIPY